MLLEVALNGSRTRAEHPAIPLVPTEHAREAAAAVAAGAGAIHVHVRDAIGRESLAAADVADTLRALHAACPGVPVGVSTGAWIVPDVSQRLALIRAWTMTPDFASVNLHEAGAIDVIRALLDRAIDIEAGVWNASAAKRLLKSGLADRCLRILIEAGEEPGDPRANLERIETALGPLDRPRLLHGLDASAWDLVALAARRGYDARIGFEDIVTLPDGALAESNAALVAVARRLLAAAGPASSTGAGEVRRSRGRGASR
jgi:uncharacterized protein (DUF849 family)